MAGRVIWSLVAAMGLSLVAPGFALAQGTGGGTIAGVVRDESGGVLPGVTIEVSSPALIERVRASISEVDGTYRIAELRPGSYVVVFTMPGFAVLRREGVELTSNFTANINAVLTVSALEETITVTAETPLIDTSSATQQKTITREVLSAVPTSQSALGIASLMPAVVQPPNAQDVGGSMGERSVRLSVHGSRTSDARLRQEGMIYNALTPGNNYGTGGLEGTGRGYYVNPLAASEIVVDVGTMGSAEYGVGGAQSNAIYRDGGNRFSGAIFGAWTGDQLQSDNLSDELREQGLTDVNTIRKIYDANVTLGGPILRDRLWFFGHMRSWGVSGRPANLYRDANIGSRVIGAPAALWRYAPDEGQPVDQREIDKGGGIRFTAQATAKDRLTFSYDRQKNFQDSLSGALNLGTVKLEGNGPYCQQHSVYQGTWLRPQSNRLLFEGGFTVSRFNFGDWGSDLGLSDYEQCGDQIDDNVSINDIGLGYTYNGGGSRTLSKSHQVNGRFSVSLMQGAHSFRFGTQWMYGLGGGHRTYTDRSPSQIGGLPVAYTFLQGNPISLTQYATPLLVVAQLNPDLGLFAQDQWRVNDRLTLSAGLRFDWMRQSVPETCEPAGPLVDARCYEPLDNVPNWKDISPRFGVVWDPTGRGRTAIKGGFNRYVIGATTGMANAFAPVNASVSSTTRAWSDANGNFYPDCDLRATGANGECGALANANFGQVVRTTVPDPAMSEGWGKRGYSWQGSLQIDHQLLSGLSISAGYFRTWYGNFLAVDNLAVTPEDYSEYCVDVPNDSRLPSNISGQRICGLYDINPDKFGQVDNIVTFASNYGTQRDIYNGFDLMFQARMKGHTAGGGWNIGNSVQLGTTAGGSVSSSTDRCFVVDSPQDLYHCKVKNPYQSRFKLNWSYLLPWHDVQVAVVYQNNPGPQYTTNITYTNAQIQPSLGRPLSGGTRSVTVEVADPYSQFGPRLSQLDIRGTKIIRFGEGKRLQLNFDLYNALNANPVINYFSTYNLADGGARWRTPTQILDGRLAKFSVQVDF
ncbi:MAG: TonB-dependent receptor [Vicinamibacterales bacterium]